MDNAMHLQSKVGARTNNSSSYPRPLSLCQRLWLKLANESWAQGTKFHDLKNADRGGDHLSSRPTYPVTNLSKEIFFCYL